MWRGTTCAPPLKFVPAPLAVASFQQNLAWGGVDPTGDRSYPPWNHHPLPGDTGTESSAVDSRPTFISTIHLTSF